MGTAAMADGVLTHRRRGRSAVMDSPRQITAARFENHFENRRERLIRLMCRWRATGFGSNLGFSKGDARRSQVEGLVRDNRVEVRVLFGACTKALLSAGLSRFRPACGPPGGPSPAK